MGKRGGNFEHNVNALVKTVNSKFGLLISHNGKIIYEHYASNNANTRFRIFHCSIPITAMAIFLLAQSNKLKLTDKISKYNINVPHNNKITINHLLNHASGIYDVSHNLYYGLKPKKLVQSIIGKRETKFVDFNTIISEINKNEPAFMPPKKPYLSNLIYFNTTGYDLLGYIIYIASGMRTDEFIKKNIFGPLKMTNSGFHHEKHRSESISFESRTEQGIKEQHNWFCGSSNVVCTLRDYDKFLFSYEKLLNKQYLNLYQKLEYFTQENGFTTFSSIGAGDISHHRLSKKSIYFPLSKTIVVKYFNKNNSFNIVLSENFRGDNGFFSNDYRKWHQLIDILNNL